MSVLTTISAYFQAGQTYTIHVPTTLANNGGFFPRRGIVNIGNNQEEELQMGFYVENKEVGEIVKIYPNKVAIDYKHKYPAENTIWFLSHTGERARIIVANVMVHDHASIATGGPAYATYFSDFSDETSDT